MFCIYYILKCGFSQFYFGVEYFIKGGAKITHSVISSAIFIEIKMSKNESE